MRRRPSLDPRPFQDRLPLTAAHIQDLQNYSEFWWNHATMWAQWADYNASIHD
jgi:hypothetical protein